MKQFKKYCHIENSYQVEFLGKIKEVVPATENWVCQEKIHGTDSSFVVGRGEDGQVEIYYPDFVDLAEEREYSLSPNQFNLQGYINRIVENEKEKFISYYKSPINGDIFSCENYIKEENNWNKNKGKGKVVMLFYEGV
jgi:hypothetical protein